MIDPRIEQIADPLASVMCTLGRTETESPDFKKSQINFLEQISLWRDIWCSEIGKHCCKMGRLLQSMKAQYFRTSAFIAKSQNATNGMKKTLERVGFPVFAVFP